MINQIGPMELIIIGILSLIFIDPRKIGYHWKKIRDFSLMLKAKQSHFEEKLEQEINQVTDTIIKPIETSVNNLENDLNSNDFDETEITKLNQKLRQKSEIALKQMTPKNKQKASNLICKKITEHQSWKNAKNIALFYPMLTKEPDVKSIFEQALNSNKNLFLPAILEGISQMEMRPILSIDNDLEMGKFGILQPKGGNKAKDNSLNTNYLDNLTIFVPGSVFGLNGERIGRGKGYYDRLLSKFPNATKVGLCFDCQLQTEENVRQSKYDITMDFIITETHIFKN